MHKTKVPYTQFQRWAKLWFLGQMSSKTISKVFYNNFLNSLEYYYR
jgi:hypothetical protein